MIETFKAYFFKEIIESMRQYRYLTLGIGILLFAVLDPVMLKIMPYLLPDNIKTDISALFAYTPKMGVQNYIKDLNQIGFYFVIFSLGSLINEETTSLKIVIPLSKGAKPAGIVLAKFSHYFSIIFILVIIGFCLNNYYVNIMFTGESVDFSQVAGAVVCVMFFYMFYISLLLYLSVNFKKGITPGILALVLSFIFAIIHIIPSIRHFIPNFMMDSATNFYTDEIFTTVVLILVSSAVFISLTIYKLNRIEIC